MVLHYIKGYESVRSLSKEEKQILPQIIMFRHYVVSSVDLLGARRDAASESDMLRQEKLIRKISIA